MLEAEVLTRLPLAQAEVLLPSSSREQLEKLMIEALKVDIPILNYLQASELMFGEQVSDNQLWLVVLLAPARQLHLFSIEEGPTQIRRRFTSELQLARRQLQLVEWRIKDALKEGGSPLKDSTDNEFRSSTKSIRSRIRNTAKGGRIWVPALPYALNVEVGKTPQCLPRGPEIRIKARIRSMKRRAVILEGVTVCREFRSLISTIPEIENCTVLHRMLDEFHFVWGDRLRSAMDNEVEIEIPVSVVLDWVSGRATSFQLGGEAL